jgi:S1-C subfamily serine protease
MSYRNFVPSVFFGVMACIQLIQVATASSSSEVSQVAKRITVLIQANGSLIIGSGFIVSRQGEVYSVLTARHVVEKNQEYTIVTPDGKSHKIKPSLVKRLGNIDLAILQFNSKQVFSIAKLGDSNTATPGTSAYIAGFPFKPGAIDYPTYFFSDGRISANDPKLQKDGYTLAYKIETLSGMSGGPILNENGEIIGIHGRGDADLSTTQILQSSDINPNVVIKTAFSYGVPVNTFRQQASLLGLNLLPTVDLQPLKSASTSSITTSIDKPAAQKSTLSTRILNPRDRFRPGRLTGRQGKLQPLYNNG